MIVGAPRFDYGQMEEGWVFIYRGQAPRAPPALAWSTPATLGPGGSLGTNSAGVPRAGRACP